jgi:hypothetical protein
VSELGPKYDCSRCVLPQKDIKGSIEQDCPRCPLAEAGRIFKAEVAEEISNFSPGELSFERILQVFNFVSRMLSDNKGKMNRRWNVTMTALARIVKSEQDKARYVELWNQRQSTR